MGSPREPTNTDHFLLYMDSVFGVFMCNLFCVPHCLINVDDWTQRQTNKNESLPSEPVPKLAPAPSSVAIPTQPSPLPLGWCVLDPTISVELAAKPTLQVVSAPE